MNSAGKASNAGGRRRPNRRPGVQVCAILLALQPMTASAARFTDFARVVASQPLYERVRVAVPARRCEPDHGEHADDRFEQTPSADSLAAHVREEMGLRRWASERSRCVEFSEYREIERLRGYRVWYQYRGEILVKDMAQAPGTRIEVIVDLQPEEP